MCELKGIQDVVAVPAPPTLSEGIGIPGVDQQRETPRTRSKRDSICIDSSPDSTELVHTFHFS